MVHELSYALLTLDVLNHDLKSSLNAAFSLAQSTVPWKNSFAFVDIKEYLASGVCFIKIFK